MRTYYYLMVFTATMLFGVADAWTQSDSQNPAGYIIKVDSNKVYLSLPNAKVSDIVSVFSNGGVMTDPRTGREIRLKPEAVAQIKIIAVQGNYSVGKVYGNPTAYLEEGMTVGKGTVMQKNDYGETTVMIAPAELNFPQGLNTMVGDGYIGDYVSAALMQHLLKSDKIQLVDRSILTMQQNEINLGQSGAIDYNTALEYGKISGVRYLVKITLQKPDVVNVTNNIPVKGIVQSLNSINRQPVDQNSTQNLPNNVQSTKVKVSVRIVVHVVDLQTGKVMFMSNGEGVASGKPQLSWEYDFGNITNSGEHFMQTVTGKAIDNAFKKIGKELNKYFKENL